MALIDLLTILCSILILALAWVVFDRVIFPHMVYNGMKETSRNPKWITSQLQYYGFGDIDIVLCESKWGMLPHFRMTKNDKFELWVDNETSVKDVDDIGRLALAGKIKTLYGLWFPEKPIYWLSILCYMLDGGDIKMESVKWEENKKPLDQNVII